EFRHAPKEHHPPPRSGDPVHLDASAPGTTSEPTAQRDAEPLLEASEIQGNIIPGFNKDYQHFVFGRITDLVGFRRWITKIIPDIATLEEVTAFNRLFAALRTRRGREGTVRATWVNIAFSYPGLQKILPASELIFDAAFKEGMYARVSNFGDVDDPHQWVVGSPGNVPDF